MGGRGVGRDAVCLCVYFTLVCKCMLDLLTGLRVMQVSVCVCKGFFVWEGGGVTMLG